jgi:uncharacterized protein (DUF2249 family)
MQIAITDIPVSRGRGKHAAIWKKLLSLPQGKALKVIDLPRGMVNALRMRTKYAWPDGSVRLYQTTWHGEQSSTDIWLGPANKRSIPA